MAWVRHRDPLMFFIPSKLESYVQTEGRELES
jgi:hypothetical protein